jgi:hypothetical protein
MKGTIPSSSLSDHFVGINKMVKTAFEPSSRHQENGQFTNSNSIEFDGIKPLEFERFRIATPV